jgi:uncharacterized protein (DUF983 family)
MINPEGLSDHASLLADADGRSLDRQNLSAGESDERPRSRTAAVARGLRLLCPNCGKAGLLQGYLKPVAACPSCGENFGHIRSDDAAPWLTILIVGHFLVPFMVAIESADIWPQTVSMIFWPAIAALMAGLVLPRAKALFISLIWFDKSPGSESDRQID